MPGVNIRVTRVEVTVTSDSSTVTTHWRVADHGGRLPNETELAGLASSAAVRAIGQRQSTQLSVQYNTSVDWGRRVSHPVDVSALRNGHALARLMREMVAQCEETLEPQEALHGWASVSSMAA